MFGEEKKLTDSIKDTEQKLRASYEPGSRGLSIIEVYPKLNKLVTAIYIVTDILDKDEPIRLKLRTLGIEILSDIDSLSRTEVSQKVQTILSFLDIGLTINLISQMNYNILKKEFLDLRNSLNEPKQVSPVWLQEFLLSSPALPPANHKEEFYETKKNFGSGKVFSTQGQPIERSPSKGQSKTSIGVQKGNTLLKALSDINFSKQENNFNSLKTQRRNDILLIIKNNGGYATITDIKNKASGSLVGCGEKTLQRELVSMIKEGVLYKTGEKRWSKYSLKG